MTFHPHSSVGSEVGHARESSMLAAHRERSTYAHHCASGSQLEKLTSSTVDPSLSAHINLSYRFLEFVKPTESVVVDGSRWLCALAAYRGSWRSQLSAKIP